MLGDGTGDSNARGVAPAANWSCTPLSTIQRSSLDCCHRVDLRHAARRRTNDRSYFRERLGFERKLRTVHHRCAFGRYLRPRPEGFDARLFGRRPWGVGPPGIIAATGKNVIAIGASTTGATGTTAGFRRRSRRSGQAPTVELSPIWLRPEWASVRGWRKKRKTQLVLDASRTSPTATPAT